MPRSRRRFTIASSLLATLVLLAGCATTPQQKYARFLQRGQKLLESSKYSRAIVEFRGAMQSQPKEAEAYYWPARAFLGENKVGDAVVALRKATDLKPEYAAAQLKLAELMIRSQSRATAERCGTARIRRILTGNPGDDDALFTLAAAEAQLGKTEDAEK